MRREGRKTSTPDQPDALDSAGAGAAAVRGGVLRVGGYLVGALLTAGAAAALFRHLGVVNTGRFVTIRSLMAIVGSFSDLGLTAIGVRELSVRRGAVRGQMASNLLGLRIAVTLVGLLGALVFSVMVGYGSLLTLGLLFAGTGLLLQNLQTTLALSLMSSLRLGWVTIADLLRQSLNAALIILLVILGAPLLPFLAATVPAGLITLVVTAILVRGAIPLRPTFDGQEWRPLVKRVLPYSVAVAAAAMYFRVSIVLVSVLATGRELGYFSAAFNVIEVLVIVPGLLIGAAFPIFARAAENDATRFSHALSRVFDVSVLVGAWVALCLWLASPVIIAVIGGERFAPAAHLLAIQGIGLGAAFVSIVWTNALLSLGRYREILLVYTSALVLVVGLVAVLTVLAGPTGAVVGTATVEVLFAIATGAVLRKTSGVTFPKMDILPRAGVAVALAASPALVHDLSPLARVCICSVMYGCALIALNALPVELRRRLPRYQG